MRASFFVSLACASALVGCGDDRPASVAPSTSAKGAALSGSASMQSLRTSLDHSGAGLAQETLPDGVRRVRLQGRFLNLSVLDSQGRAACVDSPAALDRMLGAPR